MAAKTEGIASLSMYNDEEEEEEEEEDEGERRGEEDREKGDGAATTSDSDSAHEKTPPAPYSRTTPPPEEDFHHKTLPSPAPPTPSPMPTRTPTPTPPRPPQHQCLPPPPASMPSPLPPSSLTNASDAHRSGKWSLTIVDYAHDEVAMSPEAEEGEIMSTGRVVFGAELLTSVESIEEKTLLGIVQTSTPSTQGTPPQSSEQHEQSKSGTNMTMDMMEIEEESLHVEMDVAVSLETEQEVDPLKSFLPPPLTVKCSEELQEKINKFLAYKKAGKSFNAVLRNRKDYRNPDFLQHAVTYQDIDQIGTCLSKDVFDPHGYDKSDYYDEIEADIKRGIEKREQEKKKSLEFVPGGNQAASKISTQIPAAAAAGGLQSVSAVADGLAKESRQNKKSKWDKVDSDSVSNASVHAVLLSAANAGAGYTAFAQQKRREAEEKRSSERKFDKRS